MSEDDRRGWVAMVWSRNRPTEAFGALMVSPRQHWTREEAMREAEAWVREHKSAPVEWELVDAEMTIAHVDDIVVAVRGFLLPQGNPPPSIKRRR
jgi:hypothetical protein